MKGPKKRKKKEKPRIIAFKAMTDKPYFAICIISSFLTKPVLDLWDLTSHDTDLNPKISRNGSRMASHCGLTRNTCEETAWTRSYRSLVYRLFPEAVRMTRRSLNSIFKADM